uniref:SAR3 n=1 Tax=Arundo donax TaxID=35708 RepID=A0A0A9GGK9_ARUDO
MQLVRGRRRVGRRHCERGNRSGTEGSRGSGGTAPASRRRGEEPRMQLRSAAGFQAGRRGGGGGRMHWRRRGPI